MKATLKEIFPKTAGFVTALTVPVVSVIYILLRVILPTCRDMTAFPLTFWYLLLWAGFLTSLLCCANRHRLFLCCTVIYGIAYLTLLLADRSGLCLTPVQHLKRGTRFGFRWDAVAGLKQALPDILHDDQELSLACEAFRESRKICNAGNQKTAKIIAEKLRRAIERKGIMLTRHHIQALLGKPDIETNNYLCYDYCGNNAGMLLFFCENPYWYDTVIVRQLN